MAPLKVIGAGCGRTGTESLRFALNILGYTTHHAKSFLEDSRLDPEDFSRAAQDKQNADWDKLYQYYDAAVDWPTVDFYKELYHKYPDVKVILTVRSADSWYESVKNTLHYSFMKHIDITPDHHHYSFLKLCREIPFDGALADPEIFNDKEKVKKLFSDHNEEVKNYIPADQLYVMELGSGWEGLCKFLGKETPKEPFPCSNSTQQFKDRVEAMSKNRVNS